MTEFVNRGEADEIAREGEEQSAEVRLQEATQVAQTVLTEELEDATETAEEAVDEAAQAAQEAAEAAEQAAVEAENVVEIEQPAPGQTTQITAEPGLIYVMNFDPNLAQVLIQGQSFVLLFASGAQIVFENLIGLAAQGLAPFLRVGGVNIGGDIVLAQARATG